MHCYSSNVVVISYTAPVHALPCLQLHDLSLIITVLNVTLCVYAIHAVLSNHPVLLFFGHSPAFVGTLLLTDHQHSQCVSCSFLMNTQLHTNCTLRLSLHGNMLSVLRDAFGVRKGMSVHLCSNNSSK